MTFERVRRNMHTTYQRRGAVRVEDRLHVCGDDLGKRDGVVVPDALNDGVEPLHGLGLRVVAVVKRKLKVCLLYTSPSPRD